MTMFCLTISVKGFYSVNCIKVIALGSNTTNWSMGGSYTNQVDCLIQFHKLKDEYFKYMYLKVWLISFKLADFTLVHN